MEVGAPGAVWIVGGGQEDGGAALLPGVAREPEVSPAESDPLEHLRDGDALAERLDDGSDEGAVDAVSQTQGLVCALDGVDEELGGEGRDGVEASKVLARLLLVAAARRR